MVISIGNITVNAPKKIQLNAADIELNAYNNLAVNAGNSVIVNAMAGFYVFTAFMKQIVSGMMNLFSHKTLISSKEDIAIEAKDAKLHGTQSTLVHSDRQTVINSKDEVQVHGNNGSQFDNQAKDVAASPADVIGLAKVLFRATNAWNGEYGFDWLREDDNGYASEPAYETIIQSGYSPKTAFTFVRGANGDVERIPVFDADLTPTEAFEQLKNEYENIPIDRKPLPPGAPPPATPPPTTYFVPYLTLFSKAFVDSYIIEPRNAPKPKYEATLKILVEVEEELDKLEFEFDKTLFSLSITTLNFTRKTSQLIPAGQTVTITCLKDLDSDREINIYAYPKGSSNKADVKNLRRLAGRIKVLRNDETVRREMKFVLVGVNTNVDGLSKVTGSFNSMEKENLYNSSYQALILPTIEETILDLSNNAAFQTGGKHIDGNLIAWLDKNNNQIQDVSLYTDLQKLFFTDGAIPFDPQNIRVHIPKNERYKGYFTIFAFGLVSNKSRLAGAVQDIGMHNVIMFKGRDNCTLNHESFHGLGLCHTHRDAKPIDRWEYKYVYPCAIENPPYQANPDPANATDNVMSYRSIAITTWHWQWKIINKQIK